MNIKRYGLFLCTFMGIIFYLPSGANEKATRVKTIHADSRIQRVPYQEAGVVTLHATPFTTVQIVFDSTERIENIQNGDLGAWTVSVPKGEEAMFFVKPTLFPSDTNMTVVTNRHSYYFHLKSERHSGNSRLPYPYAIHFMYPKKEMAVGKKNNLLTHVSLKNKTLSTENPFKNVNTDYRFNGDRSLLPVNIFDDGRFTYFRFKDEQALPAIFAVDNANGDESLVNYRRKGPYVVIPHVAAQWTLRQGKHHVASIFNHVQMGLPKK